MVLMTIEDRISGEAWAARCAEKLRCVTRALVLSGFQVLVPRAGSVEVPVPVPRELPPLHRKSCNVEVPGSGSTQAMKFQGSKPSI